MTDDYRDVANRNPYTGGDTRSTVYEAKLAENGVRRGDEFAWDGGRDAYRDQLAQGFLSARDNGPAARQLTARPGTGGQPMAPVGDITERPRQTYDTVMGSDTRTGAFASSQAQPHWVRDADVLAPFAYSTSPQTSTNNRERPGTVYEVQPSGQRKQNPNGAQVR